MSHFDTLSSLYRLAALRANVACFDCTNISNFCRCEVLIDIYVLIVHICFICTNNKVLHHCDFFINVYRNIKSHRACKTNFCICNLSYHKRLSKFQIVHTADKIFKLNFVYFSVTSYHCGNILIVSLIYYSLCKVISLCI